MKLAELFHFTCLSFISCLSFPTIFSILVPLSSLSLSIPHCQIFHCMPFYLQHNENINKRNVKFSKLLPVLLFFQGPYELLLLLKSFLPKLALDFYSIFPISSVFMVWSLIWHLSNVVCYYYFSVDVFVMFSQQDDAFFPKRQKRILSIY